MDAMPPIKEAAASIQASNNNAGGNARIKNGPATTAVRDAQYRSGGWNCLESGDELEHYLAVCALYQHHLGGRTVLDIGCGTGILFRHRVERTGMQPSLWDAMAACYATVEERTVQSSEQLRWKIRALKPL